MTKDIFSEVVERNLCVGCGACAVVQHEALHMTWNDDGFFQPVRASGFDGELDPRTLAVCPFNDDGRNENWIAERMYRQVSAHEPDKYIGFFLKCFIGCSNNRDIRANATSGGLVAWIIRFVLSERQVSRVIALGDAEQNDRLFGFRSYRSVSELDVPMKSRYYPSEFSRVVASLIEEPGDVLFVGLPCQIKALRKIALEVPAVADKVRYTVSLFCGHQKSRHYAEYLALHVGVDPHRLVSVDYRKKREGHPAGAYGFEVAYRDGNTIGKARGVAREVFAAGWSNNLFMNPACEFCDDVVGETADLSVGDAWLPEYVGDWRGTSICVVRHPDILDALERGKETSELSLVQTDPATVHRSQEAGFRQRREGLQYRLALAADEGRAVPRKRVTPSKAVVTGLDRLQQRLRIRVRRESNRAFRRSERRRDLPTFRRRLGLWVWASQTVASLRKFRRRGRKLRALVAGRPAGRHDVAEPLWGTTP